MSAADFLFLNLALGFYNAGTIWAHEVDIFRSWRLIDARSFHTVQRVHFRKLPYWVFAPVGLGLGGAVGLIWLHPPGSPVWGIWGALACQVASLVLTGLFWGRWQAQLAKDPRGATSPWLDKILKTHWIRTLPINANAAILLAWALNQFA